MSRINFDFQINSVRLVFGSGKLSQLSSEIERLKIQRVLLLCDPQIAALAPITRVVDELKTNLAERIKIFDTIIMHVPKELAEQATVYARDEKIDGCVAIGGGSTVGLAKAIALTMKHNHNQVIPIIAVASTFAGSEATPIWGITENAIKKTGRDPVVRPQVVIYDSSLLQSFPEEIALPSAMNALAHCMEATYAHDGNPLITSLALEGMRSLISGMHAIKSKTGVDRGTAYDRCFYGSFLAGYVLGSVAMGLHHKLCHVIGGNFNLPHAQTHTVILPHTIAYNQAPQTMEVMHQMGRMITEVTKSEYTSLGPGGKLFEWGQTLSLPYALKNLGMKEKDIDLAVEQITTQPYKNPVPMDKSKLKKLIGNAFHGYAPESFNS